jgi:hypothetical protein
MTLNDIFDLAMILADREEQADLYKPHTLEILKMLRREIAMLCCFRGTLPKLDNLDSLFGLDNELALCAVPYGLLAHLLVEENPELASYCLDMYERNLRYYLTCQRMRTMETI